MMISRFIDGSWRYGISVLAVALLFGVAANAAPRAAEEDVQGTGKSGTEVTRLVTGDPAQINAVVAGYPWLPSAIMAITPVAAKVGSYPPGTSIIGDELRAEVGGFRAWFEVQVSNWDPNANGPYAAAYQVKIDCTNYKGVNADPPNPGVDLAPAIVPCTTDAGCIAAFGENWTRCESGKCKAGYVDSLGTGRPDSWCAPDGGGCAAGDVLTGTCNYNYYSVSGAVNGRPDEGIVYYGGTLVLDIPAGARGKYTVNLNTDETFMAPPGFELFESLQETGFVVNIVTGQCCFGLGTPDEGCVDGVLRAECGDDEPGPFIFTPDGHCPPQGLDCSRFLGACCDTFDGTCQDSVLQYDCQGTDLIWSSGTACVDAGCVTNFGACCDTFGGICRDSMRQGDCVEAHRVWSRGTACIDAECIADTGACCDSASFGSCIEDVALSDCQCATCTWHKLQTCSEIECAPTPIPAISEWGLAIMTLLLLTGAKLAFRCRKSTSPRAPQNDSYALIRRPASFQFLVSSFWMIALRSSIHRAPTKLLR